MVWAILEGKSGPQKAWLLFIGWLISQAKSDDYSNYLGEQVGISRSWTTSHFLDGWPQNCNGTCGCVIQLADVLQCVYTETYSLVEMNQLPILDLFYSYQFMLSSFYDSKLCCHLLKFVPYPLPSYFNSPQFLFAFYHNCLRGNLESYY